MGYSSKQLSDKFKELGDEEYRLFTEKLTPGIRASYGIRIPAMRALAKEVLKDDPQAFLDECKHASYEETLLCAIVTAGLKLEFPCKCEYVEKLLPKIDNWSICDIFCSSFCFKQEEEESWFGYILPMFQDRRTYYSRFAIVLFLGKFIKKPYIAQGLSRLIKIDNEEYYVGMAVAWAISVCFIKFREETLKVLREKTLKPFVQNKAIQKIRESRRVTTEDKEMLLKYKIPAGPK